MLKSNNFTINLSLKNVSQCFSKLGEGSEEWFHMNKNGTDKYKFEIVVMK